MLKEILGYVKSLKRSKIIFISLIILGYITGVIISYPILNKKIITKNYCIESVGPITCQPDEDCDKECLKFGSKTETRGNEVFYTYGLLGAFIGGWVGVIVITFLLKE